MAFALLGDAERAWTALEALLPSSHASTEADALNYTRGALRHRRGRVRRTPLRRPRRLDWYTRAAGCCAARRSGICWATSGAAAARG
jgi:hypothetical protein